MIPSQTKEEAKECPSSSDRDDGVFASSFASVEEDAETFLQNLNVIVVQGGLEIDPKEYRNQFETLLGALKHAHSREASVADHCHALNTQNIDCAKQLEATTRVNADLTSHVSTLQADLVTVKTLLESQNVREDRAKEQMGILQVELERLTDIVDKNDIASARKETECQQLANDVDEWKSQASAANDKLAAMAIEQEKMKSQYSQLQASYNEQKEESAQLKDHLSEKKEEIKRESERTEQARQETYAARKELERKVKETIDIQYELSMSQARNKNLSQQLVDAKKAATLKEQELKEETIKTEKLVSIKLEQKKELAEQSEQIAKARIEEKKSTLEINRMLSEITQLERKLETERKAVLRLQQLVEDTRAAARLSSDEVHSLNKEIDILKKNEEKVNRDLLMLKRENGLQIQATSAAEEKVKRSGSEIQHAESLIARLEKELADANDESFKKDMLHSRLEGECDGLRHQMKDSQANCQRLMDEIKVLNQSRTSLHKKIGELQVEIEAHVKKYNTVRSDKNNTLKELADAQRHITALEEDKKNSQRLIDTLRSEINLAESALVKENYDYKKEKSHRELLAAQEKRLKISLAEKEDTIRTQLLEARQLGTTIRKLEDALSNKTREYEHVIHERDILGTQCLRKNDEAALLYEKIKILKSSQRRGEIQYNERLDDIRILKIKVRDLQRQVSMGEGNKAGVDHLSRALALVQKELIRERLKVKALSDELENPLNIHRWRKLEGSDPESYEMVQKINVLQKRLLSRSDEVVKKNTIIQEQEKRVVELEKTLARKPGPDVVEQINTLQTDVRKKSKQMKAMAR